MNKALIIGISMFLLLVVPALAADWDVKWSQDLCNGIVHHCYEINFSNKGDAKDFNMSLVFSESDINLRNIRNLEIDEIVETTESYKDNIIDNCNNVTIKRVNETVIEPNCTYKEVTRTAQKTNLVKQNALTSSKEQASYKENIGKINFGNSLTRRFRVEYDLPIVNSNGFGSSGKLAFVNEFTNEVYHPWWNYSYFSCKNMTFQETGVVKRINQFMIYNLTELDGMQPDADDVRIVNSPCGNDGSEVSYDLVSNTSNSADIAFIIPEINKSSNLIWAVYYNNSNAAAPVYSGKITYRDWNYTDHAAGYNVSLSSGYNVYFDNISDWYTGLWGIDHLSGSVSRFKNYNDAGNADAAHLFQIRKWDVNVRLTIVIDGVAFARVRLKKNNQSFTFDCPSISRPNSAYCSVQFSDPDYSSYYIVAFSENAQGLQDNDSNWVAMKSNNDTDDFHGLVYPSNSGFNLVCYVANCKWGWIDPSEYGSTNVLENKSYAFVMNDSSHSSIDNLSKQILNPLNISFGSVTSYGNTSPSNISIDTGNDAVIDYNYPNELNATTSPQLANLNKTAMNNYLQNCTPDADNMCSVPLIVSSKSPGIIKIDNINVQYNIYDTTPPVIHNYTISQNPSAPGDTLNLTVNATDNVNLTGVTAEILGIITQLTYNATTKLYAGSMVMPWPDNHTITITAKDWTNLTSSVSFNVSVQSQNAELRISNEDISYYPVEPDLNQTVAINATIHNLGTASAGNVNVSLFIDGVNVQNLTISIPALSSIIAPFAWNASYGLHQISVAIISNITGDDPSDNSGVAYINVPDKIPPVIGNLLVSNNYAGGNLFLDINATDNIGVSRITAELNGVLVDDFLGYPTTDLRDSPAYVGNTTAPPKGNYTVTVTAVDVAGLITVKQFPVTIYSNQTDLSVSSGDIVLTEPPLDDNKPIIVKALIHNNGHQEANNFEVELRSNGLSQNVFVMSLGAGKSDYAILVWDDTFGNDNLTVIIDPLDEISEDDETNNNATVIVNVPDGIPPEIEDIVAESVYEGSLFIVNATVTDNINVSTVTAEINGTIFALSHVNGSLYSGSTTAPSAGSYILTVNATDVSNLSAIRETYVDIYSASADLTLDFPDVSFSTTDFTENNTVYVTATIHNNGGTDANNFLVSAKLDGVEYSNSTLSVAKLSSNTTVINFTPSYGTHLLAIVADPANDIAESNEANNNYTQDIDAVDTTAPPAPNVTITPENWTTGNDFDVSFTPVSDTSGIAYYEYQVESGDWTNIGLSTGFSVNIGTDGLHLVYVRAVDNAGNKGLKGYNSAKRDTTPPNTPFIREWHSGTGWTSHNTPYFSWEDPGDVGSGVTGFYAEINNQVQELGYTLFYHPELNETGNYTVKVYAQDALGHNSSWSNEITVHVDITNPLPPGISSLTHPDNATAYNTSYIELNLTPSLDDSGIEGYYYTISRSPDTMPTVYSLWTTNNTLNVTSLASGLIRNGSEAGIPDGVWYFRIISKDNAGNLGNDTGTYKFMIDTFVPSNLSVSLNKYEFLRSREENVTVTANYTAGASVTAFVHYPNGSIANISLAETSPGIYQNNYRIKTTDWTGNTTIVVESGTATGSVQYMLSPEWWNNTWQFRVPLTIALDQNRTNAMVESTIDFNTLLAGINYTSIDQNSVRIIDHESNEKLDENHDFVNDTAPEILFRMNGSFMAGQTKTYWIYFDVTDNGEKPIEMTYFEGAWKSNEFYLYTNAYVDIFAYNDDTGVKIFNASNFETLNTTVMNRGGWFTWPVGTVYRSTILYINATKPVSVLSRNINVSVGTTEDDVYSFKTKEIYTLVQKNLWITSYTDNNSVKISDLSNGDDNYSVTLNKGEHFNSSSFDGDEVYINATADLTIVGGYEDDNVITAVFGENNKDYYLPVYGVLFIVGMYDNTIVNVTDQDGGQGNWNGSINKSGIKELDFGVNVTLGNGAEFKWGEIHANKPVLVIIQAAGVNGNDALGQFFVPDIVTASVGRKYVTFGPRNASAYPYKWAYDVIATEDNTSVNITGDVNNIVSLDRGKKYRYLLNYNQTANIIANKKVSVDSIFERVENINQEGYTAVAGKEFSFKENTLGDLDILVKTNISTDKSYYSRGDTVYINETVHIAKDSMCDANLSSYVNKSGAVNTNLSLVDEGCYWSTNYTIGLNDSDVLIFANASKPGYEFYDGLDVQPVWLSIDEAAARNAIEQGINNTLNATIFTDQKIYVSYLNGTQKLGGFDKVASSGSQRWAFNYITEGENFTNMSGIGTTLNIWENSSLSAEEITAQVEEFINSTLV